ncbi:hypothetical protein GW933_03335 [Candidatus Falkowbacteria bacterium]|uniref:histidine kinase n=1 Tax=Candidatus Buchananbacteria bacterium CG10_big_fil_rev_8_21_14_0_10_33_19 TaxID=1974525 RepID=A0A2H0W4V7_9BACT|nr:hypothetical protein [Candidatus Falkowbacteria bacterium]PIS06334.1 MAG: hypothetical protein COT80_02080 [Candidatus Buchananbacteria bacterium CG10_big_fil_rev_8_21_14_0_10_33_19]
MDIKTIILIIVSLINFFLGFIILLQRPIKKSNILFSIVVFNVVLWAVLIIIYNTITQVSLALLLVRLFYAVAVFIPLFFLFFTFVFPVEKVFWRNKLILLFISLPALVIFYITLFTNMVVSDVQIISKIRNNIVFGSGYLIYTINVSMYFLWTLINLFSDIYKSSGSIRSQLKYLFIGLLASSFISLSTNLFLPWFGFLDLNWIGQISTVIWIAFMAYALIKRRLIDVKIITTIIFSIFIVTVSGFYVVEAKESFELVYRVVMFVLTIFFILLLIRSVLNEIARREKIESLTNNLKAASNNLKKVNTELKKLDEAKSEFLSIASHQLRTPLTVIKGYVSMMQEGSFGRIPKIVKDNLSKVYLSNERLISLVESLLNISRIESGNLQFDIQPTDLTKVIKDIVEGFQKRATDKKLSLEFYPDPDVPEVAVDAQKIKEVISNIIDNSIKYTEHGSITVSLHQESQSVVFACQDTGIGVLPEDLPRLFEKFVRGKGMMQVYTEGTGLGMYFARMVVENLGGRIWGESPGPNKGSKFSFSVPLADKSKVKKIKSV